MKKLIAIILIISCAYAAHVGVFYSGKTKLTVGTRTIEETRTGSLLGVATGGIYRLETLFGNYILPAVILTARSYKISYPPLYTGPTGNTLVIPGAKIYYAIALTNTGTVTANNCIIEDAIPDNTHLYYNDTPQLTGDCTNVSYSGATGQAGPGSTVRFNFRIPPSGKATMNYTVTVD